MRTLVVGISLPNATFDNVTLTAADSPTTPPVDPPIATLPPGWQSTDVGAVGIAGAAAEADGTFTIVGAGADMIVAGSAIFGKDDPAEA